MAARSIKVAAGLVNGIAAALRGPFSSIATKFTGNATVAV
jgi:hypothetical protein